MKTRMLALLGCVAFSISCAAFADDCLGGSCGSLSTASCNPYETNCQCTDTACHRPWDSNCISRAECCEAFGNIGAR